MQSMPLLLRQSLKAPGLSTLSRSTTTATATRPIRIPSGAPSALLKGNNESILSFSAARRRQFHSHVRFYSQESEGNNNVKEGGKAEAGEAPASGPAPASAPSESLEHNLAFTLPQEADVPKSSDVNANTETRRDLFTSGVNAENAQYAEKQSSDEKNTGNGNSKGRGLPSYLENRRSRYSKQFTEMMDNLQSNVFVAGQRLNDLTGYSSIEALKKEIETQGMFSNTI